MQERAFEERFGELRSMLAEAPSQARLEALVGVLSSMSRQAPERFEAEVYPYAQAGLGRWYASAPLWDERGNLTLILSGRVAEAAALGGARWLGLMRGLGFLDMRDAGAALAALRRLGGRQLEGLRALEMSDAPRDACASLASCGWVGQLDALSLLSQDVGAALAGLGEGPRWLDVSEAQLAEGSARALAGWERLEVLRINSPQVSGAMGLSTLLQQARWPHLKRLSVSPERRSFVSGPGRALGEAAYVEGLEALEWWGAEDASWAGDRLMERAHRLEVLRANTSGVLWRLDQVMRGERAGRLRQLALFGVGAAGALEGGESLEVMELHEASAGAVEAVCGHGGWLSLRGLSLSPVASAVGALVAALSGARGLSRLRGLEIGAHISAADLERIVASGALAGLEELRLWRVWQLDAAHVRVLVAQRDALPGLTRVVVSRDTMARLRGEVAGTWLEGALADMSDAPWWM